MQQAVQIIQRLLIRQRPAVDVIRKIVDLTDDVQIRTARTNAADNRRAVARLVAQNNDRRRYENVDIVIAMHMAKARNSILDTRGLCAVFQQRLAHRQRQMQRLLTI